MAGRRVAMLLAGTLLAAAAAGCLASERSDPGGPEAPSPAGPDRFAEVRAILEEVPCRVATVPKDATSANLRTLVHLPVDEMGPLATRGELDLHGDLAVLAFYNHQGFTLLNLTDPLDPLEAGYWLEAQGGTTYDVKFTRDGTHVLVGFNNRVALVDVTEPAAPRHVHTAMHPEGYEGQAHMMYPWIIDGTEFVFVVPSISGTGVLVHRIDPSGDAPRLEPVAVYTSTAPHALYPQALAPHDVYVTFEEDMEAHVLWAANGFAGLVVLKVDDPARPETLASVPPSITPEAIVPVPTHYHSIQVAWLGEHRILATTSEVGYNTMKIYDATDLSDIRFLGHWILDEAQPTYLQHNIQIVDGTLLVAHYEHGLFAFDLAAYAAAPTEGLRPSGHWQPPPGGLVWDVVVKDGLVYLSDIPQGLHVVGYGCFTPGDASLQSTG